MHASRLPVVILHERRAPRVVIIPRPELTTPAPRVYGPR